MTTTAEILARAAEILASPESWTQGAMARDSRGDLADPDSPNACAWCLTGALMRACIEITPADTRRGWTSQTSFAAALDALYRANPQPLGRLGVPDANDEEDTTHDDVLRWLRRAQRRERKGAWWSF